jgi:predicted transcriptional regulator
MAMACRLHQEVTEAMHTLESTVKITVRGLVCSSLVHWENNMLGNGPKEYLMEWVSISMLMALGILANLKWIKSMEKVLSSNRTLLL